MKSLTYYFQNSHRRCFVRKYVLTGKHLCQSLFFIKVADLRPTTLFKKRHWHRCSPVDFAKFLNFRPEACNFIKKETLAQVFSCGFCKISKNTFLIKHLWATASIFPCEGECIGRFSNLHYCTFKKGSVQTKTM